MVEDRINGISGDAAIKASARVATTANVALSGLQTIDGVSLVAGDRVLVKNQTTGSENGIYNADTSTWQRTTDFNGSYDAIQGTLIPVYAGSANGGQVWKLDTANPIIGTSSLSFSKSLPSFMDDLASSIGSSLIGFIQSGAGAVIRTLQDKVRESVNIVDYMTESDRTANYLAPGSVDVTYAYTAWLARLADGCVLEATEGVFKFTSPLVIAARNNISIRGAGRQKTKFVYGGAATNVDLITIGDGSTSFNGLQTSGFNIDSTTTMTAGAALRIRKQQNGGSDISNISFSALNASQKLWDGIWFDNTNVTTYKGFEINVQNEGVVVSGAVGVDSGSDLYLDDGTITFATTGIVCGGGFGGLYVGKVLFYGNESHLKIDNSRIARLNREIIVSDLAAFDGCKDYGIYVNDTLASGSNLTINAFIGSAGTIGSGVGNNIHIASYPNSRVTIGSGQIFNATANGVQIDDASTLVTVSSNTQINNNAIYGLSASVATTKVNHHCTFAANGSGAVHSNIRTLADYTPTISSASGTITTASGTVSWRRDGNIAFMTIQINITTNGTGAVSVGCTLPFTVRGAAVVPGRENGVSGKLLQGFASANGTLISVMNYDGSYPGADGAVLLLSGSCEIY